MSLAWLLISWLSALCMRLFWRAWRWHSQDIPYTPGEFVGDAASLVVATVMLVGLYYVGRLMLLY